METHILEFGCYKTFSVINTPFRKKMLCNLHCLKARLRLLCNKYQRHSSLSLVLGQLKLCNIFIFGMTYCNIVFRLLSLCYTIQFSLQLSLQRHCETSYSVLHAFSSTCPATFSEHASLQRDLLSFIQWQLTNQIA